jgi:hypothetical protein
MTVLRLFHWFMQRSSFRETATPKTSYLSAKLTEMSIKQPWPNCDERSIGNRCNKNAGSIKDCIRRNKHVAITLYRDFPANRISVHSPQPLLLFWLASREAFGQPFQPE